MTRTREMYRYRIATGLVLLGLVAWPMPQAWSAADAKSKKDAKAEQKKPEPWEVKQPAVEDIDLTIYNKIRALRAGGRHWPAAHGFAEHEEGE